MNDLKTRALITASVVDTFEGRFFTERDRTVTLVEAALATSAAPTYFPPVVPQEHDRGYMDGGLWSNDPSYLALHYAVTHLVIPKESIRLLSVGTGRVQRWHNSTESLASEEVPLELPPMLRRGLAEAGITKFMPSRKYYALFRDGRESISSYISLAQVSLTMVSINLATGMTLEKVIDTFSILVNRERPVKIVISLSAKLQN
jgi:predicted acylesterase/phospholipase RssA